MRNFGENVLFHPRHAYMPPDEAEVLAILDRHAGGTIRVAGALHAWSPAVATDDVVIDLSRLDRVDLQTDAQGNQWATVGGGCTIERLVDELRAAGATLPTIGAVMHQTIAGAIATGTHGSGAPSLSHFVTAVRVATYDPATGSARISEIDAGEELRAARCAVGCMGVVLSVRLPCRREYWVTEMVSHDRTLDAVLARRDEYPLQQFMLVPYAWTFVAFNRVEVDGDPGIRARIASHVYRLYGTLAVELLPHQLLSKALLRLSPGGRPSSFLRGFIRRVVPLLFRVPRTTLPSMTALTLHTKRHGSVRHVEMEAFVPERRLRDAVRLVRAVIEWSAGTADEVPADVRADIERVGLGEELAAVRGRYMQHYPLFFRRVRPDDTLISMTSGGGEPGDYYTISLFTYLPEPERASFYALCALVARMLVRLTDARLHWGKYFPLTVHDIEHLYPRLAEFRRRCAAVDRRGAFVNDYAHRALGLPRAAAVGDAPGDA